MRLLLTLAGLAIAAQAQSYLRDVYPIWEKHCLGCHAAGTNMGSLNIETWEGLQRGGNHGTILVPGDLKASRLYTMLIGEGQPAMPMDGKVLSPSEIATVRNWISSGAPPPSPAEIALLKRRAAGEANAVESLAWRPGTSEIAVGRGTTVDLLNPATQQIRTTLTGHTEAVRWLAFSPDGQRLATADRQQTLLWKLADNTLTAKIPGGGPIAISADGQWLATAGPNSRIQLLDARTGQSRRLLAGPTGPGLAFTENRLVVAAGSDVMVWDLLTGQSYAIPTGQIKAATLSPNGQRLATATSAGICIWALGNYTGKPLHCANQQTSAFAWSPDGKRIATAGETPKLYDAEGLLVLKALPGPISSLAFSPDGTQLATANQNGATTLLML